jgi:hypothetical protein
VFGERVDTVVHDVKIAMLSMALGRIQAGQKNHLRSLLAPADRKAA